MKKLIMGLALVASMFAMASTDVYTFKTTMKYPAIGKDAFVPASTRVDGTLTVVTDEDSTNTTATLVVKFKKTNTTYTLSLDGEMAYAVFGKKNADVSTVLTFVNEDAADEGLINLTFCGMGTLKTKTTGGCTPCGDTTETCSRVKKLDGVVIGNYICPCGGTFTAWDGSCEIDFDEETEVMPIYGKSASFKLKSVDGKKW